MADCSSNASPAASNWSHYPGKGLRKLDSGNWQNRSSSSRPVILDHRKGQKEKLPPRSYLTPPSKPQLLPLNFCGDGSACWLQSPTRWLSLTLQHVTWWIYRTGYSQVCLTTPYSFTIAFTCGAIESGGQSAGLSTSEFNFRLWQKDFSRFKLRLHPLIVN